MWRRAGVVVALAAAAVPLVAQASRGETETAGVIREAWFQAPVVAEAGPLCGTPSGCNPLRPGGYPEDTLHVGNLNGSTTELTVVTFERSVVPASAELVGGTAVFPVADGMAGTVAAESAGIAACLVVESFEEVDGAPASEAPRFDCSVRSVAVYDGSSTPPRFTVDLAAFVSAWEDGRGQGIALVPDTADTGSWNVAFSGRERGGEGVAPPPSAELVWHRAAGEPDPSTAGTGSGLVTPSGTTAGNGGAPAASGGPGGPFTAVEPPDAGAPAEPVVAAPAQQPAAPSPPGPQDAVALATGPGTAPPGYAYRWAWLVPLIVLVVGGSLTRSLATEVSVVPTDAPRGLRARLWLALWPED